MSDIISKSKASAISIIGNIIEDAESHILLLNESFEVIYLNEKFQRVFKKFYGLTFLMNDLFFEKLAAKRPKQASKWKERCVQARAYGPRKIEEVFTSSLGVTSYWVFYIKASKIGPNGIVYSIFSRDVTDDVANQTQIIKSEANLRTILDSLNSSVLLIDTFGRLIDFNNYAAESFRVSYGTILERGEPFLSFLSEELVPVWRNRIDANFTNSNEICTYVEEHLICGQKVICETKILPILDKRELIGYTIVVDDVTKKRKDEFLLQMQYNELLKVNNELDYFVYSASHDLRSPLLSIMGLIDLLKRGDETDSKLYVDHIESSIKKLDIYVSKIISYSRINRLKPTYEEIDINKVHLQALEDLKYMGLDSAVQTNLQLSIAVPIYSDFEKLTIIFRNIQSNAYHYYDTSKVSTLDIIVNSTSEKVVIEFIDNGIGINNEILDKVFDMFYRGTDKSKGAGLGLYIARNAVEKLHGKISIKSEFGKGTRVIVVMPNFPNGKN